MMADLMLWFGVIVITLAAAGAISVVWWWKRRQARLTEMWADLRRVPNQQD